MRRGETWFELLMLRQETGLRPPAPSLERTIGTMVYIPKSATANPARGGVMRIVGSHRRVRKQREATGSKAPQKEAACARRTDQRSDRVARPRHLRHLPSLSSEHDQPAEPRPDDAKHGENLPCGHLFQHALLQHVGGCVEPRGDDGEKISQERPGRS